MSSIMHPLSTLAINICGKCYEVTRDSGDIVYLRRSEGIRGRLVRISERKWEYLIYERLLECSVR